MTDGERQIAYVVADLIDAVKWTIRAMPDNGDTCLYEAREKLERSTAALLKMFKPEAADDQPEPPSPPLADHLA